MRFKKGELVRILVKGLNVTPDGFATGGYVGDSLIVYESIDIHTFPSWNDFHGEKTAVKHNMIGAIIEYIGRPERIRRDPKWFSYDIYSILIGGNVRQVFSHNIRKIPAKLKKKLLSAAAAAPLDPGLTE